MPKQMLVTFTMYSIVSAIIIVRKHKTLLAQVYSKKLTCNCTFIHEGSFQFLKKWCKERDNEKVVKGSEEKTVCTFEDDKILFLEFKKILKLKYYWSHFLVYPRFLDIYYINCEMK